MSKVKEIQPTDLKNKIDNKDDFLLIDVREPSEIEISKIKESIHIPMADIPNNIDQINSNKLVVVMCKSGGRSAKVCEYLIQNRFKDIYNLNGGIIKWALEIDSDMLIY
jgi:rhodanese-related sulfurtransferase